MTSYRFFFYLKTTLIVSFGILIGSFSGLLIYLNNGGLEPLMLTRLNQELEQSGIFVDFERLRFSLTRGIVAKNVTLYEDASRTSKSAFIQQIAIHVDKTKLMRGIIRIYDLHLKGASISIPLTSHENTEQQSKLCMTKMNGELHFLDKKTLEIRHLTAQSAGLHFDIKGLLWQTSASSSKKRTFSLNPKTLTHIQRALRELNTCSWRTPPKIAIHVEGNIDAPETLRADFSLQAPELTYKQWHIASLLCKGDYQSGVFTVDKLCFSDAIGSFFARGSYTSQNDTGRFEAKSSLRLSPFLPRSIQKKALKLLSIPYPPDIALHGSFGLQKKAKLTLYGDVSLKEFSCKKILIPEASLSFSWNGTSLYITNLSITQNKQKKLSAKVLIGPQIAHYTLQSTLSPSLLTPFLPQGPLQEIFSQAHFSSQSTLDLQLKGQLYPHNPKLWITEGRADFSHFIFRKVPLASLSANLNLNNQKLLFSHILLEPLYTDYALYKRYGGAPSSSLQAEKILYDRQAHLIHISGLKGKAWPEPVIALFYKKLSQSMRQYAFHSPPSLEGGGIIALSKAKQPSNFFLAIQSNSPTHYTFLKHPIELLKLSTNLYIKGHTASLDPLICYPFGGRIAGKMRIDFADSSKTLFAIQMLYHQLQLSKIGKAYTFDAKQGTLNGKIHLEGIFEQERALQGSGNIALYNGNLFSVPTLGPLTPLLSLALGRLDPSDEKVKEASCSFVIQKGILHSDNFIATSRSLAFSGEGKLDLIAQKIDVIFRMNARGLLGVLTLPVSPFMGLFQYKGSGHLAHPAWEATMFSPPRKNSYTDKIKTPPKAILVKP